MDKTNRIVALLRTAPVWLHPGVKPWSTEPRDWKVIKLSGDRTGYVKT